MILFALFALSEPHVVDLSQPQPSEPPARAEVRFDDLDAFVQPPPAVPSPRRGTIAEPMDDITARTRMEDGHDRPGSEYPRKHTLYMNFAGADLKVGEDNSAESRSSLAEQGAYPVFTGGEPKALAAIQALENDLSPFGVRVVYLERPEKLLPYTMAMVGGQWEDTQLDNPAGGVAATADCGAINQRRVVYVFADGGWSALEIAATAAQEAGHAWGLDHTFNCDSVMSYCFGADDKVFSDTCDELCELDCQLPANCRVTHEMFCGVDSDQQNEVEELAWLFGGDTPDMEAPTVEILSPADGTVFEEGEPVDLVSMISDDYGGYAWRYRVELEGEVTYDQVNYTRDVDDMGRPFLQFVNLDPGEYVFTVQATDHADHITEASITVVVGGASADTSGTGSEDGEQESSTGDDEDDGDDEDEDGEDSEGDDGEQTDGGDEGCSCRAAPGPVPLWAAGFGLWALVRLRPSRRRRSAP